MADTVDREELEGFKREVRERLSNLEKKSAKANQTSWIVVCSALAVYLIWIIGQMVSQSIYAQAGGFQR